MQRKLYLGKYAKLTNFGNWGGAKGMYTGGFIRKVYGIKGLFTYITLECWGQFRDMEIDKWYQNA